ncbi:MAG: hypothetical protein HGN29_17710 [Asgard group archaeon]|nr:hypothetical protein [Asgard group archaeon]
MLIEIIFDFLFIINNIQLTWQAIDVFQIFFLIISIVFLGLLIWTIILFVREKKKDPLSRRYLPRLLGFLFALLLSVIGMTFSLQWHIWF